jgi:tellurite resistance protein TehA-like permease
MSGMPAGNEDRLAWLRDFFPGYFGLVMATGIVSLACTSLGLATVARVLLGLNLVAFVALWAILLARLCLFPRRLFGDLTHHALGPGFLTLVAATNVVGVQVATQLGALRVAGVLWLLGAALWVAVGYTFLAAVTLRVHKPRLEPGLSGAWLLVTVASESVAVLAPSVAADLGDAPQVLFVALVAYAAGLVLYFLLTALILYRWLFLPLPPEELTPNYWINMGAVSITALAGARLVEAAPQWSVLGNLVPFLEGTALIAWALAAWWLPLLTIVTAWRHLVQRYPLTYDPQYWSLVFPLGMFTQATVALGAADQLRVLAILPRVTVWIALAAWALTFLGMMRALATGPGRAGRGTG